MTRLGNKNDKSGARRDLGKKPINTTPPLKIACMLKEQEVLDVVDTFLDPDDAIKANDLVEMLKRDGHYRKGIVRECINRGILEIDKMAYTKRFVEMWVALAEPGIEMWYDLNEGE